MAKIDVVEQYSVKTLRKQSLLPVPEADWKRLKQMVGQVIPHRQIFQVLASVSLGIGGSTILSLIGLSTATAIEAWVLPTMWTVLATSACLGAGLLWLDHIQTKMNVFTRRSILEEMARVEGLYEGPPAADGSRQDSLSRRLEAEREIKTAQRATRTDDQADV